MTDSPITLPHFARAMAQPSRYKVLYGGRDGAKSWTFGALALLRAVERPTRFLCAREFQNSIRESVHQLLRDSIERMGLPGFTVTDQEIRHNCGSLFLFKGLYANVRSVKSTEGIDICWVEEAEMVSEESWRVLLPTIRKPGSEIWISFNPRFETDPTYQRFIKSPPPGTVTVRTSWRDNPWLSEKSREYIAHLFMVNPDEAEHVYGGEFARRSRASVLSGKYSIDKFIVSDAWFGPYYGSDWGFSVDPTTLIRFWLDDQGALYVEHEAYGVGVELENLPAMFDAIPGAREYTIRCDEARPETINFMCGKGFQCIAAPKGKGSVEDGVTWLQSRSHIMIHPRCRHTADEARTWSYKVDKLTGDPLPVLAPGNDHCWDAIRYGAQPLIGAGQFGEVFTVPGIGERQAKEVW